MQVKDKVIIVTGGNGLIGRQIVSHLQSCGAIVINCEINVTTDFKEKSAILNCDITKESDIDSAINLVEEKYGKIDGLVNNAYPRTADWGVKFEEIPFASWQKNVDMQLNSVFLLSQKVLAKMSKNKSGAIVNIASIYGVVGNDFSIYEGTKIGTAAAYSAIKGGVINFTRYLASLYGAKNIRVNCVSPGGIFDNQDAAFVDNYNRKVPMKRMGQPEDIAPAVTFLLSNEASYITGQNLVIDGGWTAI